MEKHKVKRVTNPGHSERTESVQKAAALGQMVATTRWWRRKGETTWRTVRFCKGELGTCGDDEIGAIRKQSVLKQCRIRTTSL